MITLSEVVNELHQLTADQIADRMTLLGIKGEQQRACECPIAKYLNAIFPTPAWVYIDHVRVGNEELHYYDPQGPWDYTSLERFIIRFDNGHYEGLIDDDDTAEVLETNGTAG